MNSVIHSYYNPVETYCGLDRLKDTNRILNTLRCKSDSILLLTRGSNFVGSDEEQIILEQLKGRQVFRYDLPISNPDVQDLFRIVRETGRCDYDVVLAVGGGSVLDLAKCLCALRGMTLTGAEHLRSVITGKSYQSNPRKCGWIGVPTTAGTGSEVTCWATVWDRERHLKYSIEGRDLYALAAIIDPKLTLRLPARLTVASALDAVCHATEAYWSLKTNPVSRVFAVSAIRHIVQHIEAVIDDPLHEECREQVALGSFLAGLAFSNTATTACHALSYPITLKFGVDHGIAVSMTLSELLKWNEPYIMEKEKLFEAFGASNSNEVDDVLKRIYRKTAISPRLRDYGVREADFGDIADDALHHGRMSNNPGRITQDDVKRVLCRIY